MPASQSRASTLSYLSHRNLASRAVPDTSAVRHDLDRGYDTEVSGMTLPRAKAPVHYAKTLPALGVRRSIWFPVRCTTREASLWVTREPAAVTCKHCRKFGKLDALLSSTREKEPS